MNQAIRTTATLLATYAALLGTAHGAFEVSQGSVAAEGLLIYAIGPPCQPALVWHGCLPALSLLPNLLISGIVTVIVAELILILAVGFIQRPRVGLVIAGLAIVLLLVGGGFFSGVIGLIAGLTATRINTALEGMDTLPAPMLNAFANLWPWLLIAYFGWIPLQWVLGTFFNDLLLSLGAVLLPLEFLLMISAVLAAAAYDFNRREPPLDLAAI
ncbi:MAG: hypothetical protein GYB68_03695 [Chloroflexi bacterium]|nr:hypothetical protein [Chloroflexota bacterium]